jgi:hypothetical protein
MALTDVQAMLARLFTEAPFRASFFDNPVAVGRASGLDPAEAQALSELSRSEVDGFAATLRRKRVADVRSVLPLTARALGAAFGDLARPAVASAAGPGRHRDDARAVVERLRDLARCYQLDPPWAADLAGYEATFGVAQRRRACLLVRRFRFPVAALAVAILGGAPMTDVKPCMTVAIWVRWPGRHGVFHRAWKGCLRRAEWSQAGSGNGPG